MRELKGEEVPPEIHSALNLGLDIRIPPEYIGDENQRLRAYKRDRQRGARQAERETIEKELADRYGPVPDAVRNLLDYSALKTLAEKLGYRDRRPAAGSCQHQVPSGDEGGSGEADGVGR